MRPARHRDFLFGVAYYPEHYPESRWTTDLALMVDHGVRVLRLGEYAWDVWEPRPGEYHFGLFDAVIARAVRAGLKVVLGTPTSGPPRWLSARHPEWLKRTADGGLLDHTGRMHGAVIHPGFRAASCRLVEAMAAHYAKTPGVIGWQIDNELHCITPLDFSDTAADEFRGWLRRRFKRIAALNQAWGTAFSAQSFGSFDEVLLPLRARPDGFPPQPGHLLDFYRFVSEATIRFAHEQVQRLRAANPDWLIFHNGLFSHLDYWALTEPLDCLGVDVYPGFGGTGLARQAWTAFKLEQCRAHTGSFLVPELASGAGGSRAFVLETPEPGEMRLWAWQAVAHGADGIFHFQWRTARFGQELYWHGVLNHDGAPNRRLAELGTIGEELRRLSRHIVGTVREVRIGILIESDQDDHHETILPPHYPAPRHQAEHLLGALLQQHLPAGLVHARDEFDGLNVVIVPSFGCVDAGLARRLREFVRQGGTVIVGPRTAVRDRFVKAEPNRPPGVLARLLGASVREAGAFPGEPLLSFVAEGTTVSATVGYELLEPQGAEVVGQWAMAKDDPARQAHPAAGGPAATCRRWGRGQAILLGCWITAQSAAPLATWMSRYWTVRPLVDAAPEVAASVRCSLRHRYLYLLNHAPRAQPVQFKGAGLDLISRRKVDGTISLGPFGVALIQLPPRSRDRL